MREDKLVELMISKQEKIEDQLSNINTILVKNTATLEEHQRRSIANEKAVELLAAEFTPVKKHVEKIQFLMDIVKWIITSGVILTILAIYEIFFRPSP